MKKLSFILILIIMILTRTICMGANILPQTTMGDTPYQFTNQLWNQVGFGSSNKLASFAMAQVYYVAAGIFDPTNANKYVSSDPYWIQRTETLPHATTRAINSELAKETNMVEGKPLEALVFLMSPYGDYQFRSSILFVPQKNGNGTYTITQSEVDSMSLRLEAFNSGPHSTVFWPGVSRATLTVLDRGGRQIYYGDTAGKPNYAEFAVFANARLNLPQRIITNGYTGRLVVLTQSGTNAVYNLADGIMINPTNVVPLVSIISQKVLTISGAPNRQVTVTCSPNISMTPSTVVTLTLGPIGTLTWTNNVLNSQSGFYSVKNSP